MKHRWIGHVEAEPLGDDELTAALAATLPGAQVEQLRALTGGFRNNTFVLGTGCDARVLRVYQRGDRSAWKEQRLAELVSPGVRTPKYLDIVEVHTRVVAVREFIDGTVLHEPLVTNEGISFDIGVAIGRTLAQIHRVEFDEFGDLDANLRISERYDVGAAGLAEYVRSKLGSNVGTERVRPETATEVVKLLERYSGLIDDWAERPILMHGDFGPTNLVLTDSGDVAVLDWEFGGAGVPALDFGNLLRPPLESDETATRGIAEGYRSAGGFLPKQWRRVAQLVDLVAWAEFVARPHAPAVVIDDARARFASAISAFGNSGQRHQ